MPSTHRLKFPMKLVDGKYPRISWEQAINEIGDKLMKIRKESGPDAAVLVGSSKHNNEQAYLHAQVRLAVRHQQHPTTRRASATRPPSPASRTPGATAR